MQRLAQIVARGGEEARLGADRLHRFVARRLHLRLEGAFAGDVEQQHEAAQHPPGLVAVGIGEAAHDIDHAAGEIDSGLELGVGPGERTLDARPGGDAEAAVRLAEFAIEEGGGARAGPSLDRRVDEMANQIGIVIGNNTR